jgi:protein-S-isoprenylcysteine O-methyltransferase Ste14
VSRVPSLGPRGEGWVALQIVLITLTAISGLLGPAWAGNVGIATSLLGALLMVGGAALAVRGALDLRSGFTPLPRPIDGAPLIEDGVYRVVRHPIYSGVVLMALGGGLLTASPASLLGAAALVVLFDLKSRREEAWLRARHPAYAAYRSRTRKLIPGIY